MKLLTTISNKIRSLLAKDNSKTATTSDKPCYATMIQDANDRLARMERNYLVLLKRLLEMDGIKLVTKASTMNTKVMQNINEEPKGLNERKPTLH